MPSYHDTLDIQFPATTPAGRARQQVLAAIQWSPAPTSSVAYNAASRLLLVADDDTASLAHRHVTSPVQLYVADVRPGVKEFVEADRIRLGELKLSGYLGRFTAWFGEESDKQHNVAWLLGISNGLFDQVIDCSEVPIIGAAIAPPGYHHVGGDRDALVAALGAAPDLIGEFEKPKYFDYDPSICAHGRSGITGCTNCLDACPTEAIISIGEEIEVNSHLCQGGGTCTSRCPSGAITYRYPRAEDQIELVRQLIRDYLATDAGAQSGGASLLFFDNEGGAERVIAGMSAVPEHVLPVRVEEIGVVGLDMMASSLAYGATSLQILVPPDTPDQVRESLERDVALIGEVIEFLELKDYRVELTAAVEALSTSAATAVQGVPASFAPTGNKRGLIRGAIQHLAEQSSKPAAIIPLPAGSLFGQVILNEPACTLCMGCVSVCPAGALEAGGDEPALKFIEANCVQCGICTKACPESALALAPRLHLQDEVARRARRLKQEEPFRCIKCNKPFATPAMIRKMTEKLSGHWMFDSADALNRLKMCEDCRVADMYDRKDMIG